MEIRLTKPRFIVLAVLLLGVGLFFLLNGLIVTDTKRVKATLDQIQHAVESNDADAVLPFLDDSFRLAGMNREEFRAWYADLLKRMHVKQVSQYDRKVVFDKLDPDVASVELQTTIVLDKSVAEQRIDWLLGFRRRPVTDPAGETSSAPPKSVWKLVVVRAFWPMNHQEIPLGAIPEYLP
jgi:uncharacterized protein YdiU (UPF0061 family)